MPKSCIIVLLYPESVQKMVTIVDDFDSLILQEPIFKDVRYYISGDVSEKVFLSNVYR